MQGKDTETSDEGIIKGHAYSILDVRKVDEHRLLKLRNPWGRGVINQSNLLYYIFKKRKLILLNILKEWKGRWSDGSIEWTPRYKKLLNQQDVSIICTIIIFQGQE